MAIDRLRSPFNNLLTVAGGDVGPSAYINSQVGGLTPFTFVANGEEETITGVTYRCHVFEYDPSQGYSVTFNRAGNIDLLLLAGGGGGGGNNGSGHYGSGGGGAGGLILYYNYGVTATTYSIYVGKFGQGNSYYAQYPPGEDSTFGALTAVGGGRGASGYTSVPATAGGSGGGGGATSQSPGYPLGAAGTAGQGNDGGDANPAHTAVPYGGGGGGGYTETGGSVTPGVSGNPAGKGGDGLLLNFDGTTRGIAAGGGGGGYTTIATPGQGGLGGGGGGSGTSANQNGLDATGYGNGGGGAGYTSATGTRYGGSGTSGLVIIRYALG